MFKVISVYRIFHFQSTCIVLSFGIIMHFTLKVSYLAGLRTKSCADFSKQNTFIAGNMHQYMILGLFTQQNTWRDLCMEKSTHSPDLNIQLSK